MKRAFPFEFIYQVLALLIAFVLVHTAYVTVIRPAAAAIEAEQRFHLTRDPGYIPERSAFVVLRDFEQEMCLVLMLWAMAIMGYKALLVWRERGLLEHDLLKAPAGARILPEDGRDYVRHLESFDKGDQQHFLPRCLSAALHRFAATRDIYDVSAMTRAMCESESERLESELSMVRYIAWAIPSIGFIGTVRGIGQALGLAHQAMDGNITGVTESLGVAFNSTFIALLLSLLLMFLVHQLQLQQERLVRDAGSYCDRELVQKMSVPS